jgi:hypothetical protein
VLVVALMSTSGLAAATERDRPFAWSGYEYRDSELPERTVFPSDTFTFCRIRYTSYGEHATYNRRGRWMIDYPESDVHFSWRLSELTTVNVARTPNGEFQHAVVTLTDPDLYNYPFIYIVEPGALVFTDEEAAALRDYLLRGGFLMVDDFWGEEEWSNWAVEFSRVLNPTEYPMEELDIAHPIFNCVFELKEKPQVPSAYFWMSSGKQTSERGAESAVPEFRGVTDKNGRLMAVICHNTDLGDGWEREGENEMYFNEISARKAYPMGINIVVYALTH